MTDEHKMINQLTNQVAERLADTDVELGYWQRLNEPNAGGGAQSIRIYYVRQAVAALSMLAPMLVDRDAEIEKLRKQVEVLGKACQRDAQGAKDRQTLKVSWHPNAVQRAVDHGLAIATSPKGSPDDVYRFPGGALSWMDLACLVDAGRAALSLAVGPAEGGGPDAA